MTKDYSSLISRVENRYNPDRNRIVEQRSYSELSGESKDVAKYVKASMSEVDTSYTQKSLDAGDRVKAQLQKEQTGISYEYQGSVMTQTHIKGASDIDLLTLTNKFEGTEISKIREEVKENPSQFTYTDLCRLQEFDRNFSLYLGNANKDLLDLRIENEKILTKAYCECDISKPKSIKVHLVEFNRDVDVVTSSWFNSMKHVLTENKIYMGIKIYNKETNIAKGPDYPFLSIHRTNSRSSVTNGRLKKMIRFLKNVKTDSDKDINLTSFEINAICYNIPSEEYKDMYYLNMVYLLWNKMYILWDNQNALDNLKDVSGNEYVFKCKPEKVKALKLLKDEVWDIYQDLQK